MVIDEGKGTGRVKWHVKGKKCIRNRINPWDQELIGCIAICSIADRLAIYEVASQITTDIEASVERNSIWKDTLWVPRPERTGSILGFLSRPIKRGVRYEYCIRCI